MAVFRVLVKTVFEIDTDSEYKARAEAMSAATKCQEEQHDKFSVASIGVDASRELIEFGGSVVSKSDHVDAPFDGEGFA